MADNTVNVTRNYIPQIDYLSRDYVAILEDLTAIAKQFNPSWSVSDPSDIGVALLEAFAYVGDILSFYTDRMASEGFIGTASQRSSVLQIASMLGYTPTPSSSAKVNINVKNNNGSGTITIPAGSQISSSTIVNGRNANIIFELDSEIKDLAAGATVAATATEGKTISSEPLGTSDGSPSQYFKLSKSGVVIETSGSNITVIVGSYQYTYTSSLVDSNSYDAVFTTAMDADGYTYIVFGDGVNGKIPPATYSVSATYRVGDGSAGNLPLGSLANTFTGVSVNATVTQTSAASGGSDDESTDSIRINAPRALRTLRRAVSLKDYAYLALQVNGVAKANADAAVWSNINLYIAPFGVNATSTYGPFTGVTTITQSKADGTVGTGYLKYSGAAGAFTGLVANSSYVTILGAVPVTYNIYAPKLVTGVANDYSWFTVQTSYTSFPTYYAPLSSGISISATGDTTNSFNSLKSDVLNYFTDKVAPNVTLNINPPTYIPVNLDLGLNVLPQYNQAAVVSQVQDTLSNIVSYKNSFFADRITPHFILNAITNIDGVDYANVSHLRKNSNEQIFYVTGWSRTTNTATFYVPNIHNIVPGQTVKINNVGSNIDGSYGVISVTGSSITVPIPTTTASATGITLAANTSASSPNMTVSSVVGISIGMTVTWPTSPVTTDSAIVLSFTTSPAVLTLSKNVNAVISSGTALTFTFTPSTVDNYIKAITVDTFEDGVTASGVLCASNEIPVKGVFNISATGGI